MAALVLVGATATAQSNITNARLESQPAGPLAETVRRLSNQQVPAWIGYVVEANDPEWDACCHEGRGDCCGGCHLEREGRVETRATADRPQAPVALEAASRAVVLLRVAERQVQKVHAFSERCAIDAGGRTVYWLTGVDPAASVALLSDLAYTPLTGGDRGRAVLDGALLAIAAHRHPAADRALGALMGAGRPRKVRSQAAFWAVQLRGRVGLERVRAAVAAASDDWEFRRDATFALSQSRQPDASDVLIQLARTDPSGEVRGQALFWLAQMAGRKAAAAITAAIAEDPDTKVKEQAVFALSQLPRDEGVPKLIEVARTNANPRVRKQAMFWLGQSKDPRALALFAEVLARPE